MENFLEKHKLPKLTQGEIIWIDLQQIEILILKLTTEKCLGFLSLTPKTQVRKEKEKHKLNYLKIKPSEP